MKRTFLFLLGVFCLVLTSFAQTKISGVVKDSRSGEILSGVAIAVQGAGTGTITSLDGTYSLNVDPQGTLIVSYIGYETQSIPVKGRSVINIAMKEDMNLLDEVIVVGYGTQKKSDLTGSISSVSSKDVKNYAVSNVSQLLTGKAAGVFVSSSSGQPGESAIVRVRGLGSVNDNNPLYIVDGQPLDNLNNLNPSDIDRIEVLKDASACAIYGSRGSNGVILVTTKKGESGKTSVSLDAYVGFKSSYKALEMCNSTEFHSFMHEAYKNAGQTLDPKFDRQYERGYDTNWWNEATQTGLNQNYNLNIRKGTDKMRSSLSIGYLDDEGAIITTKFNRISLRLNQEYDIVKDFITIGANVGLAKTKSKNTSSLPRFDFIIQADPFTPVINPLVDSSIPDYEYNKYAPTEFAFNPNPVAYLNLFDRDTSNLNVYGNVFANVKLFKGFSYRFQYSFERNHSLYTAFKPIYSSVFTENNMANKEDKYNTTTQLTKNNGIVFNSIVENQFNYDVKFGKHALNAMVATTYEKYTSETANAYKTGGPGNDDAFHVLDSQTTGDLAGGTKAESVILSYLGRINYNYNDTYLATVSFRTDGSSKFAKGNRWGYFPSFSLGWRISNEEFFKNLHWENVVDNLKIRAGWGQNGNQRINNNAALTLIGGGVDDKWYYGNSFVQGYLPKNIGNSEIKWETSQQLNFGVDLTLFNNSLDLTFDYFVKKTKDMLLQVPMPEFSSYPNSPWSNAGDVSNKGFEMNLNYRNNVGGLNYNIGVNLSTYKTEVTRLTTDKNYYLTGSVSRTYVGGPIGRFFGYKQIGIFQNQAEIDNYVKDGKKIQPNARPGDFIFADLSGNGAIDDEDRTFIGDPNPDLIYGFNVGLSYKNFDLSLAFQGTLGNDIWNGTKSFGMASAQNALKEAYTNAWRKEGDNASYPRISTVDENKNYGNGSSWFVENGSYLRLQNAQLGYNLPKKICEKMKVLSSLRIYVSGQNLLTFTKYSGIDPEIGSNNPLNMGYDNTRYPTSRVITMGINANF